MRSKGLAGNIAAVSPRVTESGTEIAATIPASSSVFCSRSPISTSMVVPPPPEPVVPASDMPRSNRTMSPSHSKYRTQAGLLSPSASRSAARFSGVASWPSMIWATSPGRISVPANISSDTTQRVTMPMPIRRRTIRHIMISCSPRWFEGARRRGRGVRRAWEGRPCPRWVRASYAAVLHRVGRLRPRPRPALAPVLRRWCQRRRIGNDRPGRVAPPDTARRHDGNTTAPGARPAPSPGPGVRRRTTGSGCREPSRFPCRPAGIPRSGHCGARSPGGAARRPRGSRS